jgi:hypothetical protein
MFLLYRKKTMGTIVLPEPVKLFTGIIAASDVLADQAIRQLTASWGSVDCASTRIPFDFTGYYAPEMGASLLRCWVGFERLIHPGDLSNLKVAANDQETGFAVAGQRQVNIDPGYLTAAKVVLASTKDYSHRIYLDRGIYAEVTLHYQHNAFTFLPWTYPDYQSETALTFFRELRVRYRAQQTRQP